MSDSPKGQPARWDVPSIDGTAGRQMTAGALEDLQKEAYDEAFERGQKEGLAAGSEELQQRIDRLDSLLRAMALPFDELDESVEKQLVELAMTVARQLFRRELRLDPAHVIGVVREAIGLLPIASRDVRVHLHPDDASLVRESLSPVEGERAWSIVEDPLIDRGGCKVATVNSQVDAQSQTRLNAVINSITGDERR